MIWILTRYGWAALYALLYTLIMWGLLSLFGAPSYMNHHSLDVLALIFVVALFGHASGQIAREAR